MTSDLQTKHTHTHLRLRSRVISHQVFFCYWVYLEAVLFLENRTKKEKRVWVEGCGEKEE